MKQYELSGYRSGIFQEINAYIETKIKTIKNTQAKENAKELEGYFQALKMAVLNPSSVPSVHQGFIEQIKQVLGLEVFKTLFSYDDSLSNRASGVLFEENLTKIINAAVNQSIVKESGLQRGTSDLIFAANEIKNNYDKWVDVISSETQNGITRYIVEDEARREKGHTGLRGGERALYRLGKVQGKVDLAITASMLQITYYLSPDCIQFFSLINGHNITAKNYKNIDAVSFGHTAAFRIYATLLPEFGLNKALMLQAYYIQAHKGQFRDSSSGNELFVRYVDEKIRLYYHCILLFCYPDVDGIHGRQEGFVSLPLQRQTPWNEPHRIRISPTSFLSGEMLCLHRTTMIPCNQTDHYGQTNAMGNRLNDHVDMPPKNVRARLPPCLSLTQDNCHDRNGSVRDDRRYVGF